MIKWDWLCFQGIQGSEVFKRIRTGLRCQEKVLLDRSDYKINFQIQLLIKAVSMCLRHYSLNMACIYTAKARKCSQFSKEMMWAVSKKFRKMCYVEKKKGTTMYEFQKLFTPKSFILVSLEIFELSLYFLWNANFSRSSEETWPAEQATGVKYQAELTPSRHGDTDFLGKVHREFGATIEAGSKVSATISSNMLKPSECPIMSY